MALAQQQDAVESPNQAVCPEHPEQAAVATCERCGRYVCEACRGAGGRCGACLRVGLQDMPSSAGRARVAVFFLWMGMAVEALGAVLGMMNLAAPGPGPGRESLATLLIFGELVARLGTAISFLMWQYRAVKQLLAMGLEVGETPGWAMGWWFVPFANLTRPYRVVRQMVLSLGGETLAGLLSLPLWWGLWLGGNMVGNIQARVGQGGIGESTYSLYYLIGIVSALLSIGAAALCARIVREVQAHLDLRREGRG